ncbi:MAG: hypothetical protein BHV87_00870 [Clostridiales bacterium 36_14]|nr:MAG: hypothetical protein BHV87_00870 [Clostridiales bacterium 36_14]
MFIKKAGLVDTAADKIEEVVDVILFEIGGCVNPVPAAANDITVAVLKFIAEILEKGLDDGQKTNVQMIQVALKVKYGLSKVVTTKEGDK